MLDQSFVAIGPEVMLSLGALLVLGYDIAFARRPAVWAIIAGAAITFSITFSAVQWDGAVGEGDGPTLHFARMLVVDGYAAFGTMLVAVVVGVGLMVAWDLVEAFERRGAEFVALALVAAAGFQLMAAAADLVFLFLALEVGSISLYVLAGFTRDRVEADESALKYFLLGSFASALFLYGVALAYAGTGETNIYGVAAFLRNNVVVQPEILLVGIGLMVVGLGFKVTAAPFHMWAPDVYQGAPGGVTGYLAAVAKIGGFVALGRVLTAGLPAYIDDWAPIVAALAAVSVVVGTVLAIAQSDIKRMLAYSGVAHAGFILMALVGGTDGLPAMWFYLSTYALQLLAAFGVAAIIGGSREGRSDLADYAGLGARHPALAGVLTLTMLAMGGIPLTAGFVGKAVVFGAAVDAGYTWLVVVGVVTATAGLFFYLRVIVLMYMQAPAVAEAPGTASARPATPFPARLALGVAMVVTILFGVAPWPLLDAVADAIPL